MAPAGIYLSMTPSESKGLFTSDDSPVVLGKYTLDDVCWLGARNSSDGFILRPVMYESDDMSHQAIARNIGIKASSALVATTVDCTTLRGVVSFLLSKNIAHYVLSGNERDDSDFCVGFDRCGRQTLVQGLYGQVMAEYFSKNT